MNATVLIHEATFGDDKQAEARDKKHSTVSEAYEIGARMNAFRTILTHYSQRYRSFPPIPVEIRNKVILAFDFMSISFRDLLWACYYTSPLLLALPSEEEEEGDEICDAEQAEFKSRLSEVGSFANVRNCAGAIMRPEKKRKADVT